MTGSQGFEKDLSSMSVYSRSNRCQLGVPAFAGPSPSSRLPAEFKTGSQIRV